MPELSNHIVAAAKQIMEAAFLVGQLRWQALLVNRFFVAFSPGPRGSSNAPAAERHFVGQETQTKWADTNEPSARPEEAADQAQRSMEPEQEDEDADRPTEPEQEDEDIDGPFIKIIDEDEECYTTEPALIVLASDGVTPDNPAILMTFDLSCKIQWAVLAQREYAFEEQELISARMSLSMLETKIRSEINDHELRLMYLKEGDDQDALQKELENLRLLLVKTENRYEKLGRDLQRIEGNLRRRQGKVISVLEEAFITAELIPSKDDPEPESDPVELALQEQYEIFVRQRQEEEGGSVESFPDIVTRDEQIQLDPVPMSSEEQAVQDLKSRYWEAREELGDARYAFDNRELARERAREERSDVAQEDFDVEWVGTYQGLTRALINVEATFAAAKAEALEAGIELEPNEQRSNFLDHASDGYRTSFEVEISESISPEKILAWRVAIPNQASPDFQETDVDIDDWEGDELELSESISTIAEGPSREKIDKWRQVCYGSCFREGRSSTCAGSKVS